MKEIYLEKKTTKYTNVMATIHQKIVDIEHMNYHRQLNDDDDHHNV